LFVKIFSSKTKQKTENFWLNFFLKTPLFKNEIQIFFVKIADQNFYETREQNGSSTIFFYAKTNFGAKDFFAAAKIFPAVLFNCAYCLVNFSAFNFFGRICRRAKTPKTQKIIQFSRQNRSPPNCQKTFLFYFFFNFSQILKFF